MKLAVFGSTGGNGRLILIEAVRRGHQVTAFARRPEALSEVTELTGVVGGDARDPADAAEAVVGQDAVIMTVSARGEPGAATAIARTVAAAMAEAGVSRLVATSAYGMIATRPYVLAPLVRRAFRSVFADQAAADQVIEDSGLDWTILRATRLTPGRAERPARVSAQLFTKGPYSLARVGYAAALVDLAENGAHVRHVINITGGTRE